MEKMAEAPDDLLLLNNQLCFVLYASSRKVIQLYAPLLNALDITYTQYITLLVLWEYHELPVKDLCDYLMLDTGTLTPLLKKLEAKQLVTRTRSKVDERSVIIKLTSKGLELKQDALKLLPDLLCSIEINSSEMIGLRDQLKKLLADLEPCAENVIPH